jgi:hypothetical protein
MGMTIRVPTIPAPAERRIRREARSATLRELALALRQRGWTLANIGVVLGVSTTRALQIVHKAEREVASLEMKRVPPKGSARDSEDPLAAGRQEGSRARESHFAVSRPPKHNERDTP